MHINHIAIWAKDINKLCRFYQFYFGASVGDTYTNPARGFTSRFVSFGPGARIEIMHRDDMLDPEGDPSAPGRGYAHFAVSVGSIAEVDRLTARLQADGYTVLDGPRRTGDGCYESAVLDPEGNRVEVTE